ncbi:CGNR zinc finger domain-containing protein [Dokdonella soli]|uniref:Zinc finger CGNR domain-containing protein n=1 Tax=Dokdonella soli TaxID=529810 RepID=A0ABN1IMM4_9GAMM
MNVDIDAIERVGGRLCLDFVNTRASHFASDAQDYLHDYIDLVRWMRGCEGGLGADQARRLTAAARAHPRRAAAVFAQARDLRDLLYRVLNAAARGDAPTLTDVDILDRELAQALAQRRLVPGPSWRWSWADSDALALPLWQALESAGELLVSDDLARLKQCPAPDGCGWLFYDVSKNSTRRWCSMRMCGNGAKARRFQSRQRDRAG